MTPAELYASIGGDYEDVKNRLMNDRLITKYVVKFLNDGTYAEFLRARTDQNEELLFRASHTLKGVCANLSFVPLAKSASDVCEYYRPGNESKRAGQNIDALFSALDSSYNRTIEQIRSFAEAL